VVGVLRGHPERLLLAAAADHDRDARPHPRVVHRVLDLVTLAREARILAPQHRPDDLQRFLKPLETVRERAEFDTEAVVLPLVPARSDAQHRAPAGDDVQRGHGLRQDRRVPVGVTGDQRGQLHRTRRRGQRTERRVALQHRLVRRAEAGQLVEVVHQQDGVEAGPLGLLSLRGDQAEQLVDAGAGVGEVRNLIAQTDRHGPEHTSASPPSPGVVRLPGSAAGATWIRRRRYLAAAVSTR
jgi:hypothetical protein